MLLIASVIIVPVVMDPVYRMLADAVGNLAVVGNHPGAVVVGGGIPGVPPEQEVVAAGVKEIVGNSHRHIEAKSGRSQE
jgi:hypothetical protein